MTASTFIFVRHGESDGLHEFLAGRNDRVSLTETGFRHAQWTAAYLTAYPIDSIISSPQPRAQQTAAAIAVVMHKTVTTGHAFDECDFGAWTGTSFSGLENRREWKIFNAFRSIQAAPGGESLRDVQTRVVGGLLGLKATAPGETTVIVTHADVIRAAISFFGGTPLDLFFRFRVDPASVSIIVLSGYTAEINCVNHCPVEPRV